MDRRIGKELTRMGKKMDYLLFGMKMDKRKKKQHSSVGKRFLKKSGMKMGLLRIE